MPLLVFMAHQSELSENLKKYQPFTISRHILTRGAISSQFHTMLCYLKDEKRHAIYLTDAKAPKEPEAKDGRT